jgi:hypothetical protein
MSEMVHLFIIATLATAIIGAYGWGWRLHSIITKRHEGDLASCKDACTQQVQRLNQDFYEYKLHVASEFVTLRHLGESEARSREQFGAIGGQFKSINEKLDRIIFEGRVSK